MSVQGALQSAQTCRRGRCLIVRGPSNIQLGRNGMTNMATRAARPTQGVGACGIGSSFEAVCELWPGARSEFVSSRTWPG